jgi:hypothetical protein
MDYYVFITRNKDFNEIITNVVHLEVRYGVKRHYIRISTNTTKISNRIAGPAEIRTRDFPDAVQNVIAMHENAGQYYR